ncbi:MAG: glycosyltransferase [Bacteroidales bacterium]|nr:glycosyltransferase [Bacteroidales bacterium]
MCNSGYLQNKVFISFIVPVYNACQTLRRCVDSLRNQGLTEEDYEIILVNDGSTDGSGALCEDLSAGHLNTRILTQKNGGLSVARNAGIQMARGEYICFVDADDCLIPGGIRPLLAYCDEGIALVRYWCEIVCPGTSSNQGKADGQIYFRGRGKDFVKRYGLETFCWNYLYRRAFIESSQLFFTPGLLGEDFSFMFDVLMADPPMVAVAATVYRYYINPNSLSTARSLGHSRRWVASLLSELSRIRTRIEPFRTEEPFLYTSCRESLDARLPALFSRILTSQYTITDFKSILHQCTEVGLLPWKSKAAGRRARLGQVMIHLLTVAPFLYPVVSWWFIHFFLPWIYPRLDRNRN